MMTNRYINIFSAVLHLSKWSFSLHTTHKLTWLGKPYTVCLYPCIPMANRASTTQLILSRWYPWWLIWWCWTLVNNLSQRGCVNSLCTQSCDIICAQQYDHKDKLSVDWRADNLRSITCCTYNSTKHRNTSVPLTV